MVKKGPTMKWNDRLGLLILLFIANFLLNKNSLIPEFKKHLDEIKHSLTYTGKEFLEDQ